VKVPLKVLVLGGTRFIGRHITHTLLGRGDTVTLLHRGRSRGDPAWPVTRLLADRRAPPPPVLAALDRDWNLVIDCCASTPADLEPVTPVLTRRARHYLLLSTCSVYAPPSRERPGPRSPPDAGRLDERSPTVTAGADARGRPGAAKLACEHRLGAVLADAGVGFTVLRLGLVAGAHDTSDRLAYWLERGMRGGDVLVPLDPGQPLRLIDVRDVARFAADLGERRCGGVYNVAGGAPGGGCDPNPTAGDVLNLVVAATGARAVLRWVPEAAVLARGVRPWTEVPLWLPAGSPARGLMDVSSALATRAGLRRRPLADTIGSCAAWHATHRRWNPQWLTPDRERHLLGALTPPRGGRHAPHGR
jgi:2'-hydroxyisoflavone reductase